jgi:hypothetical protein
MMPAQESSLGRPRIHDHTSGICAPIIASLMRVSHAPKSSLRRLDAVTLPDPELLDHPAPDSLVRQRESGIGERSAIIPSIKTASRKSVSLLLFHGLGLLPTRVSKIDRERADAPKDPICQER